MITAHIHEVTGSNPVFSTGTILVVANRQSNAPGLTYKGTRQVTHELFPLAGIIMSGSFASFDGWEQFEAAIEEDDFKAACRHPAVA